MQVMNAVDAEMMLNIKETANDTLSILVEHKAKSDETKRDTLRNLSGADSSAVPGYSQFFNYYFKYPKYTIQATNQYGIGEQRTSVNIAQLDVNIRITRQKLFAQIKIPYMFIRGKLTNTNGLSDITLGLSYIVFHKNSASLSLTGGVKIPSDDANLSKVKIPLPMVYQTSLGSTDALLGLRYSYKKWDFTAGYQHSFNANKNEYLKRSSEDSVYNSYFESNKIHRADDGIFRVNRNISIKKITTSAGLLFIYHIADDEIETGFGERIKATGSKGLTLNLNFAGVIPVSKKIDLILIWANPVILRKSRPDGLTRSFVAIAGFKYSIF